VFSLTLNGELYPFTYDAWLLESSIFGSVYKRADDSRSFSILYAKVMTFLTNFA
jgi:hypothetical protein